MESTAIDSPVDRLDSDAQWSAPSQGEFMGPDARFWRVYREEASKFDDGMIDAWNGSLDVLLIFAGLFSAVSTAFIIESYKELQQDFAQYSARLLFLALTRSNGSLPLTSQGGDLPNPDHFVPSRIARWTNGLWFLSLVLSLSTALVCILAKTWLAHYRSFSYGSSAEWVHHTVFRYNGLTDWRVRTVISTLPVALHLSLFLFFAGLVLFLVPLDGIIAFCCGGLSLLVFTLYATSLCLPLWRPDCPYRTPLLAHLENAWASLKKYLPLIKILILSRDGHCGSLIGKFIPPSIRVDISMRRPVRRQGAKLVMLSATQSGVMREREAISRKRDSLTAEAIHWLIHDSPHLETVSIAVQAIGSLHPFSREIALLRTYAIGSSVIAHIRSCFPDIPTGSNKASRIHLQRNTCPQYVHYLRCAQVLLSHRSSSQEERRFALSMTRFELDSAGLLDDQLHGDMQLLAVCGHWLYHRLAPRVSSRRMILNFFMEEEERKISRASWPSNPRFTWDVLMHALRCFAYYDNELKEHALSFISQSLLDFLPQMKRDMLAVSQDLRLLIGGDSDWTAPPPEPSESPNALYCYPLETWSMLLQSLAPTASATALLRMADIFIDLAHTVADAPVSAAALPTCLGYLASNGFMDGNWSHFDLMCLHRTLWAVSRSSDTNASLLIPPVLNLLRFSAEQSELVHKMSLSFADIVRLWLPPMTAANSLAVVRHLLSPSSGSSTSWAVTCSAGGPSLHLGCLANMLARSLRICRDDATVSDFDERLIEKFFDSDIIGCLIQAVYMLTAEQAQDPEITRCFSESWLSALRNMLYLQSTRPDWSAVRDAFTAHPPAHSLAHGSSYNWSTYRANSWLREWLA